MRRRSSTSPWKPRSDLCCWWWTTPRRLSACRACLRRSPGHRAASGYGYCWWPAGAARGGGGWGAPPSRGARGCPPPRGARETGVGDGTALDEGVRDALRDFGQALDLTPPPRAEIVLNQASPR